MSQSWHAHWAEDAYKPVLLGNWEVPNWHPKWPCVRHCRTTTFVADKTGRLLPGQPRSKRSPWGDYKGTWQLPSRIDRKMAEKLSAPPKYKMIAWEAHKKLYEGPCGISPTSPKRAKPMHMRKEQNLRKTVRADTKRREKTVTKTNRLAIERSKKVKAREPTPVPRKAIQKSNDGKKIAAERRVLDKEKEISKKTAKDGGEKTSKESAKNKGKVTSEEHAKNKGKVTSEEPGKNKGKVTSEEPAKNKGKVTSEEPAKNKGKVTSEEPAKNKGKVTSEEPAKDKGEKTSKESPKDKVEKTSEKPVDDKGRKTFKGWQGDEGQKTFKEHEEDERQKTFEERQKDEGRKTFKERQQDELRTVFKQRPENDKEKNAFNDYRAEKIESETEKSQKIKCLCVHGPQSPKEFIKPKRNICTIHQRLRV